MAFRPEGCASLYPYAFTLIHYHQSAKHCSARARWKQELSKSTRVPSGKLGSARVADRPERQRRTGRWQVETQRGALAAMCSPSRSSLCGPSLPSCVILCAAPLPILRESQPAPCLRQVLGRMFHGHGGALALVQVWSRGAL